MKSITKKFGVMFKNDNRDVEKGETVSLSCAITDYENDKEVISKDNYYILTPHYSTISVNCTPILRQSKSILDIESERMLFEVPGILVSGKLYVYENNCPDTKVCIANFTDKIFTEIDIFLHNYDLDNENPNDEVDPNLYKLLYELSSKHPSFKGEFELLISYIDSDNILPNELLASYTLSKKDIKQWCSNTQSKALYLDENDKSNKDKDALLIDKSYEEWFVATNNREFTVPTFGLFKITFRYVMNDKLKSCHENIIIGDLLDYDKTDFIMMRIRNHGYADWYYVFGVFDKYENDLLVANKYLFTIDKIKGMIMLACGNSEAYLEIELYSMKEGQ